MLVTPHDQKFSARVEYRECSDLFFKWLTRRLGGLLQRRETLCRNPHHCSLSLAHPGPLLNHLQSAGPLAYRIHMMEQLLDLSLLKVEERSSVLLGRCRSLLERRRTGLGLVEGWSLFMQARAAVRKTLWMLFSDVNAEHSRYASAPSCLAKDEPYNVKGRKSM